MCILKNKLAKLDCLAEAKDLDIIVITEIWWNEKNQWDTIIPFYKLYRKDRLG